MIVASLSSISGEAYIYLSNLVPFDSHASDDRASIPCGSVGSR